MVTPSIETPACLESEMTVLGLMLTIDKDLEMALSFLDKGDFVEPKHAQIFSAIYHLSKRDMHVDVATVYQELKDSGHKESFSSPIYLVECIQRVYMGADIESHIRLLKDKRAHRELIQAAHDTNKLIFGNISNVSETIETVRETFFHIARSNMDGGFRSAGECSHQVLEHWESNHREYCQNGSVTQRGIDSGYPELNKLIHGLCPGNLIVLAARTSVGKTALALNIAHHVGFNLGLPTAIFSLEMQTPELVQRLMCIESQVNYEHLESGKSTDSEIAKVRQAVDKFQQGTVLIHDKGGQKASQIKAGARRIKEKSDIKLLIIDYLQLVNANRSSDVRQNEVAEVSRELKTLAKDLDIPVLCLAQLSRKAEERESKRPVLSDLRESGAIEQDSDIVMFLTRPSVYDPYDRPGMAYLHIAKNRHGSTGIVDLKYKGEISKFETVDKHKLIDMRVKDD